MRAWIFCFALVGMSGCANFPIAEGAWQVSYGEVACACGGCIEWTGSTTTTWHFATYDGGETYLLVMEGNDDLATSGLMGEAGDEGVLFEDSRNMVISDGEGGTCDTEFWTEMNVYFPGDGSEFSARMEQHWNDCGSSLCGWGWDVTGSPMD